MSGVHLSYKTVFYLINFDKSSGGYALNSPYFGNSFDSCISCGLLVDRVTVRYYHLHGLINASKIFYSG